jgi:hypothetical protein
VSADDGLEALLAAYAAILDEARGRVAAGSDAQPLEARILAAGRLVVARDAGKAVAVGKAERRALQQLERVNTIHRARARLAREPQAPAAPPPPLRRQLRTRPTISANMDVRRETADGRFLLAWDATSAVSGWEVRFSERPDARADYAVRETHALPPEVTSVELPLGDRPLRVHLLGRSRDGRLLRRAVISALTRESWSERWERRASAS